MSRKGDVTQDTWFIARASDNSTIHHGFCPVGTRLDSGQEIVEEYLNEVDYLNRLGELGVQIEA
jgi:hypothetical protein